MRRFLSEFWKRSIVIVSVLSLAFCGISCGSKKAADVEIKVPDNAFPSSSTTGKKIEMDR